MTLRYSFLLAVLFYPACFIGAPILKSAKKVWKAGEKFWEWKRLKKRYYFSIAFLEYFCLGHYCYSCWDKVDRLTEVVK